MEPRSTWGPYIILKDLGKGGYSYVKLAMHSETNDKCALKITLKEDITEDEANVINNEVSAMRELDHPNIVKLYNYNLNAEYISRSGATREVWYLALELWWGGDIFDWVAETGSFSEPVARYYFHQLIEGLGYMHAKGTSHRDLKLENILFDDKFTLKIADFGFVSLNATNSTRRGTQGYMAPEILHNSVYSGQQVDVFAAGVMLFTMVAQRPPFVNATEKDPYYKLICANETEKFWKKHERLNSEVAFSDEFKELVTLMLGCNGLERPSVSEIKESAWYNGELLSEEDITEEFLIRKDELGRVFEARNEPDRSDGQGVYVYRSAETDSSEEVKIDLTNLRVAEYVADVNLCTKFFAKATPQQLFSLLMDYQQEHALRWEFSETEYSVMIHVKNPENVKFTVNILKVDEEKTWVEVIKQVGDRFKFSLAYDQLKKFITS